MSKKKIGVIIGVVVIIVALGGTGFYFRNDIMKMLPIAGEGSSTDKVYVERVSRVMNQSVGSASRYNGIVETQDTFEVKVDSNRTVKEIKVEVGDVVEEGQTLLSYDTDDLKMQIAQAELEVESINNDIANYVRQKETLEAEREKAAESEKFSYTTQIQNIENSISQRNFDLESKQLEISKYQTQVSNSTVASKVAGVVKEINENGIDANGNSAPFMTILQTGEYRVKGTIDEQNIWTLSEGQAVVIRSRVDETKTWKGTIALIDTEKPQQSNNDYYYSSDDSVMTSKYPFYIELETAEGLILGQHVYIEMDMGQEEVKEGIWLYSYYIVQEEAESQDADTQPYVWVADDRNRLTKRYVELGKYDADLDEYEIVSGLTVDDYITWPMQGIYEGVTTVTNMEEVDYSSPLYNQQPEIMDEGMNSIEEFGTESLMEVETSDTEVAE